MRPNRQLWRLMAAMIAMIIVYAAPTAVQAHGGHAHQGSQHTTVEQEQVALLAPVRTQQVDTVASKPTNFAASTKLQVVDPLTSSGEPRSFLRTVDDGTAGCPGSTGGPCCGKKACCAPCILSGQAQLPTMPYRQSSVILGDLTGRLGAGPGALPEPPRTLA